MSKKNEELEKSLKKVLNSLGLNKFSDLLYYFPRDYDEYENIKKVNELEIGKINTIEALVYSVPKTFKKGNLKITSAYLDDGSGRILSYWFNIPFINKKIEKGKSYIFRGRVSNSKSGINISQSVIYKKDNYLKLQGKLTPLYPLARGITNVRLINIIEKLLDTLSIVDYLPEDIINKRNLKPLNYALRHIHFPNDFNDLLDVRKRLVYDEFFLFSLALLHRKKIQKIDNDILINSDKKNISKIKNILPYKLTNDQIMVINQIIDDFNSGKKMNRLVQGDVGSGKTIVAIIVSIIASIKNVQSSIMVPTEVLAEQHYNNLYSLVKIINDNIIFGDKKIEIGILTGSTKSKERKEIISKLKNGIIDIIIGTHALYSNDVIYKNLGLCVIDEQHRFGVKQRYALESKSKNPHVLVMSATPIPRTLAMLLYMDMEISYIKEVPKNRIKIKNCVIHSSDRKKGYKALYKELEKGHQAYVICPAIEKSEEGTFANYQNVIDYANILSKYYGKDVKIGIMHGKMKQEEKNSIMNSFKNNNLDILVSTTVIEVGVDVPNATFIMVEDANHFGLAELHQLRGRVGRGTSQSYALFVDTMPSKKTKQRLNIINESSDGFFIAEEDLKLRGPGDIFGIKQSGEFNFKIADLYTDVEIFKIAKKDALNLVNSNVKYSKHLSTKLDEYFENGYTI